MEKIKSIIPCEHCLETGEEPNGWTYDQAKADPKAFWDVQRAQGKTVLVMHANENAVPQYFFNENGTEKCKDCRGSGEITTTPKTSSTGGIYNIDVPQTGNLEIIDYSERAIALRGKTKPHKGGS